MSDLLSEVAKQAGFKFATKQQAIAANCCIKCGNPVEGRIHTAAGQKEYKISGMCEICFDDIWKED